MTNQALALATVSHELANHSGAESDAGLVRLWLAGRSAHTARAYGDDAGRLLAFLSARGRSLRAATLADLADWAGSLAGAPSTLARRLSAAESLLTFGQRTGFLTFNVGAALKLPSRPNELAERILSEHETHALIAAAQPGRDRALLRFLYASGARVAEACGLAWRHVQPRDDGEGQVTLHGKGGKTRHVLLPARVVAELAELRGDAGDDAPVFASRTGRRLSERDARRVVARAAEKAALDRAVSPHWLRHAHASHALDRGAPVHLVQSDLGHASVATTGRYLHARPKDGSARFLAV